MEILRKDIENEIKQYPNTYLSLMIKSLAKIYTKKKLTKVLLYEIEKLKSYL
jgi:hypothetical protein